MNTLSIKNILLGILAVVLGSLVLYQITQQAYGAITINEPTPVNQYQTYDFFASTTPQTGTISSTVLATTTTATSTSITSFFDSVTGNFVNGSFSIRGAKQVDFYFGRGDTTGQGNVGTTTFKVQVTRDGTTWHDYNQLQRITNVTTGDTYFTRVANTNSGASLTNTGAATSTLLYRMDTLGFKAVRCIVVETTDGEHQCAASASW